MASHRLLALALLSFSCAAEDASRDAAIAGGDAAAAGDASLGPADGGDAGCIGAACAPGCGDGMLDPQESCERNDDCGDPQAVCRGCFCRDRSTPVEIVDAQGDVAAGTRRQVDFVRVSMTIPEPPAANFEMRMADGAMPFAEDQRICLVLLDGGTEVQRLCWVLTSAAMFDVTFWDPIAGERSIAPAVTIGMFTPSMRVLATVGLRLEPGVDFYWVSYYGAIEADRLPNVGVLPLSDVLGR